MRHRGKCVFLSAFPVCTDLSLAGAVSWGAKREANPDCQTVAASRAKRCAEIAEEMGCDKYYIENPRGALGKLWRRADFEFTPCEFGGYLPTDDTHPLYPKQIPGRDKYTKRTGVWHSSAFTKPEARPVEPIMGVYNRKGGGTRRYNVVFKHVGSKDGVRGKDIKSCTPRGWAAAVYAANHI